MINHTIGSSHKVLCDDGIVRTARVTATADTWFSLPARVNVNGKTVSGFISSRFMFGLIHKDLPNVWSFSAYRYRKNHAEIKEIGCKQTPSCRILLDGITWETCNDCRKAFAIAKQVLADHPELMVG